MLFGKVTYLLDPEITKMQVRGLYGSENSTSDRGP